jgi:hypothetical protein
MNSPNCTNNGIAALEIQIIEIVLYLNTNLVSTQYSLFLLLLCFFMVVGLAYLLHNQHSNLGNIKADS